ncbi:MAG: hypothetical protein FWD47_14845, partial [Treponema sp.]|nr:hypothetical protein [Treponema sp.]
MNEHIQDRLITILATKFNNGYRVSSNIEFERLRNFYVIEYGEEFLTDSSWLKSFCSSNALLYDDRAYFFDNDTVVVVISYITQVGSPCIFIDYLYERHITDFYGIRIFSVDMLRAFINKYCPDISINADYITLQDDISPADLVKAISKENDKWTIEELQERLPYLKVETIKQAKKSDEYLRVGTDTYVHIDNMDLPDAEGLRIISIIEMYLDKFDNVTLNEIDLSKFEELNPEFS